MLIGFANLFEVPAPPSNVPGRLGLREGGEGRRQSPESHGEEGKSEENSQDQSVDVGHEVPAGWARLRHRSLRGNGVITTLAMRICRQELRCCLDLPRVASAGDVEEGRSGGGTEEGAVIQVIGSEEGGGKCNPTDFPML